MLGKIIDYQHIQDKGGHESLELVVNVCVEPEMIRQLETLLKQTSVYIDFRLVGAVPRAPMKSV